MHRVLAGYLVGLVVFANCGLAVATLGVGVGTGKIDIDEGIKSGSIYTLPPIPVFNTGTIEATYSMHVTLNEEQPQIKPNPEWFSFSPSEFDLEPGRSQLVTPTFSPPLITEPGEYFAYLEARPTKTVQQGAAAVGVAAATKLSFEVTPSNIFIALLYRLLALFHKYELWIYITLSVLVITIIIRNVKKRFEFNIRKKSKDS